MYLLFSNLSKQSFIHGISDDFLLAAMITMISIIPVFFLKGKKKKTKGTWDSLQQEK
jgi:hypothetical protein